MAACWAGFTYPVAMSCVYGVCAFVLLRCFSCSHTVLPKEHSLGVIFFSSLSSCLCCIFLNSTCISLLIILCMIVYVTNNKEPWTFLNEGVPWQTLFLPFYTFSGNTSWLAPQCKKKIWGCWRSCWRCLLQQSSDKVHVVPWVQRSWTEPRTKS